MALPESKFYRARVAERFEVAQDLWKVKLDPGGDFGFAAGQYATIGVRDGEKLVERAYSIVSSPYESQLELFFELVPGGELTPQLYHRNVGDEISLRKIAKGRFTLDLESGHKNHFLLATVTGIAPFVSYVRTLYRDWKENKMPADLRLYIVQGASRSIEFGYREEMERFAAEVRWLTYVPTVSRPWEDPQWAGETGRVEDLIRKYGDTWGLTGDTTTAYLCGHPQMVELGMGILKRRRFPNQSLKKEVFWVPRQTAAQS